MNKVYVFTSDGEVVVASTSKEKIVDFAVDYILDGIIDEIEEVALDDFDPDGDEYEEAERIEKDYQERIKQWATDLVDGNDKDHYSDEFSNWCSVWISVVELI